MIKTHNVVGHNARQRRVKIAAVRQKVRSAVAFFGGLAEDHVEANLAGVEVLVVPGAWIKRRRAQDRLKAEVAQNLHGVTADLDSGAEAREAPGLLVDRNFNADPP